MAGRAARTSGRDAAHRPPGWCSPPRGASPRSPSASHAAPRALAAYRRTPQAGPRSRRRRGGPARRHGGTVRESPASYRARPDLLQFGGQLAAGTFELVVLLQVHPALGIRTEIRGQPQGDVGGDAAPLVGDLVHAGGGDANGGRQRIGRKAERLHELLAQDLAGVYRWKQSLAGHVVTSFQW